MTATKKINEHADTITVTQVDYLRLVKLVQDLRDDKSIAPENLRFLGTELQRAIKTDSKLITPDFVTMNSIIKVCFLSSSKAKDLRLVYPKQADFGKGLISVLSPMGCALLGYKKGDVVNFMAPAGEQKVRIDDVIYQPEAHGEDLY